MPAHVAPHSRLLPLALLLYVVMLGVGGRSAHADHFDGGTLSWVRDQTFVSPTQQRFIVTYKTVWRWSSSDFTPSSPSVASVVSSPYFFLNAYDGNGSFLFSNSFFAVVDSVNSGEDWFVVSQQLQFVFDNSSLPVRLQVLSCCRISPLLEGNSNQNFLVETVINSTLADQSPQYTGPMRLYFEQNTPSWLPLQSAPPPGLTNTAFFNPPAASGLPQARPMGIAACSAGCAACFGSNAGICALGMNLSSTGMMTWTPQVTGLYGMQFMLQSRDNFSNNKTATSADVVVSVVALCPLCPRPIVTVASSVTVGVGLPLSLPINVTHPTAGTPITMYTLDVPAGATVAPLTGTSPHAATFQWTPASTGSSFVCFQADAGTPYRHAACTTINVVNQCAPGTSSPNGLEPCTPCAAGTFSATIGATSCAACDVCASDEYETAACLATQGRTCAACDATCLTCAGGTASDCTSCATAETPVAGACLPGCTPTPAVGCRAPLQSGKAKLIIKDDADDPKDLLKWKWLKGQETTLDALGDPVTTDAYSLCVYDGGVRVSTTGVPAGGDCAGDPCWTPKATGFGYKDTERSPDGALVVKLKAGADEKALALFIGKGDALETPNPSSFVGPVVVQLQRGDGALCFESVFSPPYKKNFGGKFIDLAD